ncbi:MAG TPA: gamma carbonic anhydrase family protein [Candidatus Borkfalkia excrementipullorum]|nr:gamma carbonic anhydrase family protein [Candidatus Borkfalkia excrementipullorum]
MIKKDKNVFIHERAYVAGDVTLLEGANIWCGACVRGDIAPVVIGKNTNVQDNATIHVGYNSPAVLGDNVTVGHNAVVHGCTVGNNVLVGMGSVILDGAKIGDNVLIGAATLIPQRKEIPAGSLVFGNPFRIVRQLTEEEIAGITRNAEEYLRLAESYAKEGQ